MRKLILFLTLLIGSQLVQASTLVLRFPQGKFKVVLDGSVYRASNDLHFDHMYPGTKSITIIRESRNRYGHCAYRTVYDGRINVPVQSRVVAEYYRGMMNVHTSPMGCQGDPYNGGYQNGYGNYNGNGCGNNNNFHGGPGYGNPYESTAILDLMHDESFDSDRLSLGMSYVKRHGASAQQIKNMALLFSFDSNRLKFARQAYAFCVNPQDYYCVASTFTFSSNKRALLNYIG